MNEFYPHEIILLIMSDEKLGHIIVLLIQDFAIYIFFQKEALLLGWACFPPFFVCQYLSLLTATICFLACFYGSRLLAVDTPDMTVPAIFAIELASTDVALECFTFCMYSQYMAI